MQKLYIAKSKSGKYYAKIKNNYLKCEKIVSINLPEGVVLPRDYGNFDCEYYLSCYRRADGETELVIKVTRLIANVSNVVNAEINPLGSQSISPYDEYQNATEEIPF